MNFLRNPTFWLFAAFMEALFAFSSILKEDYGWAFVYMGFFLFYMNYRQYLLKKQKKDIK